MPRDYAAYVELAHKNLTLLLTLIEDTTLSDFERSLALESLGYSDDDARCLPVLFRYAEHPTALLREGAVQGFWGFKHLPTLVGWLEKIAATDPDEDVRAAAQEWIT